jgi:hypothetical protein
MPLTDGRRETEDHNGKRPRRRNRRGLETWDRPHMLRHACWQMPVTRYPLVTGLPRAQEYPAHGAVHRVGADTLQGLLALTIYGTSQKMPDFRQQMSRIIAWLAFDSGKVRGASNIGGCPVTAGGRGRILVAAPSQAGASGGESSTSPASSATSAVASSTIGAAAIIRCSRAASSASVISLSRLAIASAERCRSRDCAGRP